MTSAITEGRMAQAMAAMKKRKAIGRFANPEADEAT